MSKSGVIIEFTQHRNGFSRRGASALQIRIGPPALRSTAVTLAAMACALLLARPLEAVTYTWDGGGFNNNISTAQNWVGDLAPTSNSDIIWAGTINLSVNVDFGGSFRTFTFDNTADAFVLSGAAVSLSNGATNNSANAQTINVPLTMMGAQTLNAATADFVIGGTTLANGGFLLTVDGANNTSIGNVISGSGGLTKTGAGTLTLSGANTYSGATNVSAGTLTLATSSGSALGSVASITVNSGGTLFLGADNQRWHFRQGKFQRGQHEHSGRRRAYLERHRFALGFWNGHSRHTYLREFHSGN